MADITFTQLQAAVADLAQEVARDADQDRVEAQYLTEEATDTARVAEQIGAMRVDTATIGETKDLAQTMAGLSEAVGDYAAASDGTAKQALAVHAQNQTSHGGIHETAGRSPVGQEIYNLDREFLRQE